MYYLLHLWLTKNKLYSDNLQFTVIEANLCKQKGFAWCKKIMIYREYIS